MGAWTTENCKGCFADVKGVCSCLTKVEPNCNFYKTKEQYKKDLEDYPYNPGCCKDRK